MRRFPRRPLAANRRVMKRVWKMTYETFREQPLFSQWEGFVPLEVIEASRRIMLDTAAQLEALGAEPPGEAVLEILRQCVEAFNDLDAVHGWIETIEREDLCAMIDELATLAGIEDADDVAGEWRDW